MGISRLYFKTSKYRLLSIHISIVDSFWLLYSMCFNIFHKPLVTAFILELTTTRKDFLNTLVASTPKSTINNWDHENDELLHGNGTVFWTKQHSKEREKTFINYTSPTWITSKIYRENKNPNIKETDNPILNRVQI